MAQNKNFLVIAVIAVVNALGYGIIIPVLYSFSQKFGLSDFQNGLLFSLYSVCQFLATPVIGRLSDKFGRKPLLLISLIGTAVSFLMMAFAQSGVWLFLARALDGITAGNIPVASAVISDTTAPQDRAKGFGMMGAAFGFGFVFGPAISAFTVGWNAAMPFMIAAVVTLIAVVLTFIFLPETNLHLGQVAHGKLFDLKKLVLSIFDKNVGVTLLITLFYSFALSLFIYAFQPFSVKILKLTASEISTVFTVFGLVGLVTQAVLIPKVTRKWAEIKLLTGALIISVTSFIGFFLVRNLAAFYLVTVINAFANAFVNPMLQALLSKEVDSKSQGTILGLNSSYMSLGMIVGPVVGGMLASISIPFPFLAGSLLTLFCFALSFKISPKPQIVHEF